MSYKESKMTQPERLVEALSILSQVSKDEDRKEKFKNILDRLCNKMGKINDEEETEENEEKSTND